MRKLHCRVVRPHLLQWSALSGMTSKFNTLLQKQVVLLISILFLMGSSLQAQTRLVATTGVDAGNDCIGSPCLTIQHAVDEANPGDDILIDDGTYNENVLITTNNLYLHSVNGYRNVIIQGSYSAGPGARLGTIHIQGAAGTTIGDLDEGLTIIGYDSPNPGIEHAAIYAEGDWSNTTVRGDSIEAVGEAGFLSEFASTGSTAVFDYNIFSGVTFIDSGTGPGGCGFNTPPGAQFMFPNYPRQLAVFGPNYSDVTFTNNEVIGTAGGFNSTDGCEQGNTLVTIDSDVSSITNNLFAGTTTRDAVSLRVRGDAASISCNIFDNMGLSNFTRHMLIDDNHGDPLSGATPNTIAGIAQENLFTSDGAYVDPPGSPNAGDYSYSIYKTLADANAAIAFPGPPIIYNMPPARTAVQANTTALAGGCCQSLEFTRNELNLCSGDVIDFTITNVSGQDVTFDIEFDNADDALFPKDLNDDNVLPFMYAGQSLAPGASINTVDLLPPPAVVNATMNFDRGRMLMGLTNIMLANPSPVCMTPDIGPGTGLGLGSIVYPEPVIIAANTEICTGETDGLDVDLQFMSMEPTLAGFPVEISWTSVAHPNIAGNSNGSKVIYDEDGVPVPGDDIGDILVNGGITPEDVVYTITPQSGGADGDLSTTDDNCQGSPIMVTVTVYPELDASLSADLVSSCIDFANTGGSPTTIFDLSVFFQPSTTPGGTWTYIGGPGGSIITNSLTAGPGCHTLRYTVDVGYPGANPDCESMSDEVTLLLIEEPQPDFDLVDVVCWDGIPGSLDLPTTYNGQTFGDGATDRTYSWAVTLESGVGPVPSISNNMAMEPVFTVQGAGEFEICLTETLIYASCVPGGMSEECSLEQCHTLTVNQSTATVDPSWTNIGPFCEDNTSCIDLNAQITGTTGGAFAGTGVDPSVPCFNPSVAGAGTHSICYTVTQSGCTAVECHNIVVHPTVNIDLLSGFAVCEIPRGDGRQPAYDLSVLLNPGTTPGGTWSLVSGPGNIVNGFITGNAGCYEVAYTVSSFRGGPGGCSATETTFVRLTEQTTPDFDIADQVCWDGTPGSIVLDAFYNGSTFGFNGDVNYSWTASLINGAGTVPSFSNNAVQEPSIIIQGAGEFEICLTESMDYPACPTTGGGLAPMVDYCPQVKCHTLIVTETAVEVDASWTALGPQCEDNATCIDLEALVTGTSGGVFSGVGVSVDPITSNYCFDPSSAGPGIHSVCYTVNNGSGCTAVECRNIEVFQSVSISLLGGGNFNYQCQLPRPSGLQPIFDLSLLLNPGTTLGGTWTVLSGPGSAINGFISGTAGCYQLEYSVSSYPGAIGACTETATTFLRLREQPQPDFDLAEEVCWDGVPGSIVLPTLYDGNTFGSNGTINYDWSVNLLSATGDVPTFSDNTIQEPTLTIQGAGTFEVCLTESMDYPACGGLSDISDDCPITECHILTVTETAVAVSAAWTSPAAQCEDDARIYLGAAVPGMGAGLVTGDPNGVFSGEGVVEDAPGSGEYYFDPAMVSIASGSEFKDVNVCYTVNSPSGCTAVECHDIRVYEGVNIDLFGGGNFSYLCQIPRGDGRQPLFDLSLMLNSGSTLGGTWTVLSGPGRAVNGFISGTAGCYELEYTVSAFGGADGACTESDTTFIRLTEQPTPGFDLAEEVCWDGVPGSVILPTVYNGNTYGNNATINYDWSINTITGGPAPMLSATDVQEPTLSVEGAGVFEVCLTESMDYTACGGMTALTDYCGQTVCHILTITETSEAVDASWMAVGPFCNDDLRVYLGAASGGMGAGQVTGTLDGVFSGEGVVEDPMGSGQYYFDPSAILVPVGVEYVVADVCYTVNSPAGCTAVECQDIRVYQSVDATIGDVHVECASPSGSLALTSLFGPNTTPGGSWRLVGNPPGAALFGDVLLYTEPGCYRLAYSVSAFSGADGLCMDEDNGFVLITEQPQPSFDIQDEVCFSDGDADLVLSPLVNSPMYGMASILNSSWTVMDNVIGASVTIDPNSGMLTISDELGSATISGSIDICYREEIHWNACGNISPSVIGVDDGCAETFCLRISVEDGTALDATFAVSNDEPCPGETITLTANTAGGVFEGPGVTDDGNGLTGSLTIGECGVYAVTYNISTGIGGCTNSYTANITTDRTAPTLNAPTDMTVECDGMGNTMEMQDWLDQVNGSDNCTFEIDTILFNRISGCHSNVGQYVYQFIATDTCGNQTTEFATFTIEDTTPPVIIGGRDMDMEECTMPPAGNFPEFDFWLSTNAGALDSTEDLCGNRVYWSNNYDPMNWDTICGNSRFVDVTFYAEDECLNVDSITRRFSIGDVTPPVFTNLPRPEIVVSAPATWCYARANFSPVAATDNCSGVTLTRLDNNPQISGDTFPVGITVLTWEARDSCGNADTASLKIIVNDEHDDPIIECPSDTSGSTDPGMCGADISTQLGVDLSPVSLMDNCPDNLAVIWEVEDENGDIVGCGLETVNGFVFPEGENTVTYIVQDQPLLLITEIVQEGPDSVELTNFGPASIEISCLNIQRIGAGAEIHIVPINIVLMPGETYVAGLMNDIDYNDAATYRIYMRDALYDEISTNGGLDGGDIWRTRVCDHDTEEDWLVTVECKASLGMVNPGLPVYSWNGTKTGIQAVEPGRDTCSFLVTVTDMEAPSCKMADTVAYTIPGLAGAMGETCISQDFNVTNDELIGGVILRNIDINYPDLTRVALSLRGPDGTEVEVLNRPCTNVPNILADFADFGTRAMSAAGCTESLDGGELWLPEEAFKAFYGKMSQGTWTLDLSIDGAGLVDIGSWTLEIIELTDFAGTPIVTQVDPNTAPDMCGDTVDWLHPVFFDNCCEGSMTVEYTTLDADTLPMGGTVMSGAAASEFFGLGTTTVTYTLTDEAGNTAMCSFDVIVEDPLGLCTPDCQSNCQVSCIQDINVSLNENCEVPVVPSMVSENIADECNFYYDIEIRDEHGNLLPNDTLNAIHVGHCFTVTLIEPECGNSCWTQVCVEDKFPPEVIPNNDTMNCVTYQMGAYEDPDVIEHCQSYELRLIDEIITNRDCDPGFQKLVTQDWIAIDASGNVSDTMTQSIWISRFPMGEIEIDAEDTTIYCGSGYETIPGTNHPTPEEIGVPRWDTLDLYPLPDFFCNMLTEYEDILLFENGCTKSFARNWKVTEWWCRSDSVRRFRQVITIVDTVGPTVQLPVDTVYGKAGRRQCSALVDLPSIDAMDACNEVDRVDIDYPGGFIGGQNGGQANIEIGTHEVIYRVFDECYNETQDTLIVVVEDEVAPIAVCEQNTVVTLDNDGIVHVYAEAFDDGSFDECALDKMEVRRMEDNCGGGTDEWGEYVEFCCADLDGEHMVSFRVTDKSGNVNTCMVRVTVQDKQAPRITPLPDITVDCQFDWDPQNLNVFGTFVFDPALRDSIIVDADSVRFDGAPLDGIVFDNCPPVMEERLDTSGLTNCGLGYIVRYFTFTDGAGNVDSTSQRIDIENYKEFSPLQIDWPNDIDTVNVCGAANFRPQLLPEAQAFPRFIDEDECSLVGYDYKDELIDASLGNEACFKIIRTWTVIDWCQLDNGIHPKWTHDQVIEVRNTEAPTIISECTDTVRCVFSNDCEPDTMVLTAEAVDSCTASEDLYWVYKIDLNSNGINEIVETGNDATGLYPIGVHRIKWIVEDLCGNQDSCAYTFEIRNCKAPTAYCKNGVIAELTPMDLDNDGTLDTEMAEVWAEEFDEDSGHPCDHPVVLSFSADTNDRVRMYDCDSLVPPIRDVTIWVTDRITGNVSKCRTFVNVQDNNNEDVCGMTANAGVSGLVKTEWDVAIEESEVELAGTVMGMEMTDRAGEYAFQNVPLGGMYEVVPAKDGDDMNGVSTADLIRIQRHLLGMAPLSSPYQYIAADVNNTGNVSAADIAELRKLILGVYNEFPRNESWRFVDQSYVFPDPQDPWLEVFPEQYDLHPFEMDMIVDFVGVKIGDLNGDVQFGAQQNSTRSTRSVIVEDGLIQAGRMYEVMFNLEDLSEMEGYQFTVEWNTDKLQMSELIPNLSLDMSLNNFGMALVEEGMISTSWYTMDEIRPGEERLFAIRFTALENGQLSEMLNITDRITRAEVYNRGEDLEAEDLRIEFRGGEQSNYFALYQNEPNPWSETTIIGFHIPQADEVLLTLFDETGRMVKQVEERFESGYNEFQLNASSLQGRGVLYYRLETTGHTATKKMVLID